MEEREPGHLLIYLSGGTCWEKPFNVHVFTLTFQVAYQGSQRWKFREERMTGLISQAVWPG